MSPRRSRSGGRRRQNAGQPVVEVVAEAAPADVALQIAQRHRDDAHAHRDLARAPDPPQPPGLEHAQQLRLQVERQLPDLVEHQRPARRLLEPAGPARRPRP